MTHGRCQGDPRRSLGARDYGRLGLLEDPRIAATRQELHFKLAGRRAALGCQYVDATAWASCASGILRVVHAGDRPVEPAGPRDGISGIPRPIHPERGLLSLRTPVSRLVRSLWLWLLRSTRHRRRLLLVWDGAGVRVRTAELVPL